MAISPEGGGPSSPFFGVQVPPPTCTDRISWSPDEHLVASSSFSTATKQQGSEGKQQKISAVSLFDRKLAGSPSHRGRQVLARGRAGWSRFRSRFSEEPALGGTAARLRLPPVTRANGSPETKYWKLPETITLSDTPTPMHALRHCRGTRSAAIDEGGSRRRELRPSCIIPHPIISTIMMGAGAPLARLPSPTCKSTLGFARYPDLANQRVDSILDMIPSARAENFSAILAGRPSRRRHIVTLGAKPNLQRAGAKFASISAERRAVQAPKLRGGARYRPPLSRGGSRGQGQIRVHHFLAYRRTNGGPAPRDISGSSAVIASMGRASCAPVVTSDMVRSA